MAVATKKKKDQVFTKAEIADRMKEVIERKLGLLPDGVTEDGYYYDGKATMDRIKEMRKKGLHPRTFAFSIYLNTIFACFGTI